MPKEKIKTTLEITEKSADHFIVKIRPNLILKHSRSKIGRLKLFREDIYKICKINHDREISIGDNFHYNFEKLNSVRNRRDYSLDKYKEPIHSETEVLEILTEDQIVKED